MKRDSKSQQTLSNIWTTAKKCRAWESDKVLWTENMLRASIGKHLSTRDASMSKICRAWESDEGEGACRRESIKWGRALRSESIKGEKAFGRESIDKQVLGSCLWAKCLVMIIDMQWATGHSEIARLLELSLLPVAWGQSRWIRPSSTCRHTTCFFTRSWSFCICARVGTGVFDAAIWAGGCPSANLGHPMTCTVHTCLSPNVGTGILFSGFLCPSLCKKNVRTQLEGPLSHRGPRRLQRKE